VYDTHVLIYLYHTILLFLLSRGGYMGQAMNSGLPVMACRIELLYYHSTSLGIL